MKTKLRIYSTSLAAVTLVLFLILVSSAATAAPLTITETRITTNGSASNPDIYGDRIVWQDTRNGGNDVYMYDRSTNTETRITTSKSAVDPAIYGNMIVWSDERNGNYGDIYTYDLSAKKETRITTSGSSVNPDIYGNKIVWSSGGICLYDISTKNVTMIAQDYADPEGMGVGYYYQNPAIYGNTITWIRIDYDYSDYRSIEVYDLSTKLVTYKRGGGNVEFWCSSPDINNNRVVWAESEIDRDNICVYDFSTGNETIIPISGSDPRIYEDRIVWGNSIYDLSTKSETKITTGGSASNPHIYGDRIVWQDSRNGGYDIYMVILSNPTYPAADFSSNVTSGTAPLNVAFTDKSTGSPTTWNWSFGDGTANSTVQIPKHTYSTAGNYTVTLTATNSAGSNTITKSNYIKTTAGTTVKLPVVYFWASRTSGTVPITIGFTDASTNTPTAWYWDLGDGTYSTVKNPKHTYTSAGTYSITLTAGNAGGNATKTRYSYIKLTGTTTQKPVASFTSNVTSGKVPLSVLFSDTSTGTPTAWNWNFGDGTANATVKNPVHVFSKIGVYTVTLTASNSAGSSTIKKSSYITASSTTPALVANFSSNVTSGTAPLNVAFTDKSTGTPTAWNWSFGDGTSSTVKNPVHLYSKAGNYTVKLTVKNAAGSTNTATKTSYIKVKAPTTVKPPVVSYWASRTSGKAPITIGFTDASTNTPTAWKWNFGDGTYSTAKNPKHTYSKAGTYSITLTASNAGGSATKTRYSYIKLT